MPPTSLQFVTAHRLEDLAQDLFARWAVAPLPPLLAETVVVPSRGMSRWLNVELARDASIAASIAFPFPISWVSELTRRVLGPDAVPDEVVDPFGSTALPWRIHALLGDLDALGGDDIAPLRHYLRGDQGGVRRGQLARRLARLFSDYQLDRALGLRAWRDGKWWTETPDERGGEVWQRALWNALCDGAGDVMPFSERWLETERLLRTRDSLDLGPRLFVFGVSSLPPMVVRLLAAAASHQEVVVHALVPSTGFWEDLRGEREREHELRERGPEYGAFETLHPLLDSMGRAHRLFHGLWLDVDESGGAHTPLEAGEDFAPSLLGRLQSQITDAVAPTQRETIAREDRSMRVHVCHSELREMEVLREEILRAFEERDAGEPADVLVLVPDVERYAPFARAVLGRAIQTSAGEVRLPVRVADRPAIERLSFARLAQQLLLLAEGRRSVAEMLGLLEILPLRRRFAIHGSEIPAVRELLRRAGIVWGSDPVRRAEPFDVPAIEGTSWREGVDRLLLGLAMGSCDELVEGLLPVGEATTASADLVARLAQFSDTMHAVLDELRAPRSLARWSQSLSHAMLQLTHADSERETEQRQEVLDALADFDRVAGQIDGEESIPRQAVGEALLEVLEDTESGRGFVSGSITVAELRPMRSLPYDVIAVAGLDGDAFPRNASPAGFDLIAAHRDPRRDRDPRDDDRQLFLELLLSARRRMIFTYCGASARDNRPRARSVCLDEMLEAIDRGFEAADGEKVSRSLVVAHRLHPYHAAYGKSHGELFTYDREIARVRNEPAAARAAFLDAERVDDAPLTQLEVEDLARFWRDPSKWYCKHALGLHLYDEEAEADEEILTLDGLVAWQLRDAALQRTGDLDLSAWIQRHGLPDSASMRARVRDITKRVAARREMEDVGGARRRVQVDCTVDGAKLRIVGALDVYEEIGRVEWTASDVDARASLPAWVRHVAFASAHEEVCNDLPLRTRVLSLRQDRVSTTFATVNDPDGSLALLVRGYLQAREKPLWFFPRTAQRWFEKPNDRDAIGDFFQGSKYSHGEGSDEAVRLLIRDMDLGEVLGAEFQRWSEEIFSDLDAAREGKK